jgi:hypothetical protein
MMATTWVCYWLRALILALVAGSVWGQPMYKVVTPEGKVVYGDQPPAAGQGSAQQLQRAEPGGAPAGAPGPVVAPRPGGPGVGMVPRVTHAPPGEIMGGLRGSKEMDDSRECRRANAATLSLIRAAEEVMRSVNNLGVSGAKGAPSYQSDLLDRQWKYYKSLGGTAASPEQVRLPENPCRQVSEALRQKGAVMEAKYRECAASHPKEIKLSALSRQLLANRGYLAMLESVQEEKRRNPKFDSEFKGSGEWAAAFKADPALARAQLALQFQEYRSAGGTAPRLEGVTEIPNPCVPEAAAAPRPSPITDRPTLTLPGQ